MTIHYSWTGPADGASRESVLEDTLWLRAGTDDKAAALRAALRQVGVEPQASLLVHFYPDGMAYDFGCVVTVDDRIVSFDLIEPTSRSGWRLEIDRSAGDESDTESDTQLLDMAAEARAAQWPCPACRAESQPFDWTAADTRCGECGWAPPFPPSNP